MERPDQEAIDAFVSIAGVSPSIALQKLLEHGGDVNSALDAFFAVSDENNVPVTHVSAPREDSSSRELGYADNFRSEFPPSPSEILDDLFGSNDNGSMFREPSLFPARASDERNFTGSSVFDTFHVREPFASHPREVREFPIEVKDRNALNGSVSSPRHVLNIVDVTDTEHDHGPGISGIVSMDDDDDDDDFAYDNDIPSRTTQFDYAADYDVTARSAQTDYLEDDDDLEEQMILAAIEASQREAEEKQLAKTYDTAVELDLVEDSEECPRVKKNTKSLSSSLGELPKEAAEHTSINFSSTSHQDQNTIFPSVPYEELDTPQVSLPQEPLPDENDTVNILIHMSDECCLSRRFLKSDKLKVVFDFIQRCGGHPESYKLAISYPRRTFSDADGSLTLEEIGITSKQETLYLETV